MNMNKIFLTNFILTLMMFIGTVTYLQYRFYSLEQQQLNSAKSKNNVSQVINKKSSSSANKSHHKNRKSKNRNKNNVSQ